MKKTAALLSILNLACLAFLLYNRLPLFAEFLLMYGASILAIVCGFVFARRGSNTVLFSILVIISFIAPVYLGMMLLDSHRYAKDWERKENVHNLEKTVEWRNQNCTKNAVNPTTEGYIQYKCQDGSSRFYLLDDTIVKIENAPDAYR